jgi:hypothetical protein
MTQTEFCQTATPRPITLEKMPLTATPVRHKAGSCGWRWKGALYIQVNGEWVKCLASLTLTAVGSKKWAK